MRHRITTLMCVVLTGLAFAQGSGVVHAQGPPLLQIGTTLRFEGWEAQEPACQQKEWYELFMKVTGQVILPETQANVYHLAEYWGGDNGHLVLRQSPRGDLLQYNGTQHAEPEIPFLITGPVGTYSEYWNEEEGHLFRLQIAEVDVNHPFPAMPEGEIYDNLTRIDFLCMDCGAEPPLKQQYWVNNDIGFLVGSLVYNTEPFCWRRAMWLAEDGITRQHGNAGGR